MSRRAERKQKKKIGTFGLTIISLLIILIFSAIYVLVINSPYFKTIPYIESLDENRRDKINVVVDSEPIVSTNYPVLKDDRLYIPVDLVKEHIDEYIFWDKELGRITVTTEDKVIQMKTDELNYFINNKPFKLNFASYNIDGTAYLPTELLTELYNIEIKYIEENKICTIDLLDNPRYTGEVIKNKSLLRYEPTTKSYIQQKLVMGDKLFIYGDAADYTKVRTDKGLVGYVKKTDISEPDELFSPETKSTEKTNPDYLKKINGKINIIWDQVTTVEANSNENRRLTHKGLDVLSPTWFKFDVNNLNGDIVNIADIDYVNWAHENNYQVWALISDITDDLPEFYGQVSNAVLANTEVREYVIKQLLAFVSTYNLDGINIDYETFMKGDSEYFIQFLRELYPLLKEQEVILSVDTNVPKPYNIYGNVKNIEEIEKASDFIILMAYDEFHATSDISGPVASIGFVEEGIIETLKGADKENVILGLPYYVRVWREVVEDGEIKVSSNAYSMERAYGIFEKNNVEFVWNEQAGSFYGEYITEEEGEEVTYKVWLEDAKSIEEKLKLVEKYDLAGIAGWKRGLEEDSIWELLYKYLGK